MQLCQDLCMEEFLYNYFLILQQQTSKILHDQLKKRRNQGETNLNSKMTKKSSALQL